MTQSIDDLVQAARQASPNDRIELFRDAIASRGKEGIEAMQPLLVDPEMWRFAVRVIGRIAEVGPRQPSVDALRLAGLKAPLLQRTEIDAELARLGAPGVVRSGPFGKSTGMPSAID